MAVILLVLSLPGAAWCSMRVLLEQWYDALAKGHVLPDTGTCCWTILNCELLAEERRHSHLCMEMFSCQSVTSVVAVPEPPFSAGGRATQTAQYSCTLEGLSFIEWSSSL